MGPQGAAGTAGPRGPRGPAAVVIPFSIAGNGGGLRLTTDDLGEPAQVAFAGFGNACNCGTVHFQRGEWDTGTVAMTEHTRYPDSFVMPFDGTLRSIQAVFTAGNSFHLKAGDMARPFVCLAVCAGSTLEFHILKDTVVYGAAFGEEAKDASVSQYSIRRGSKPDLNTALPAGTLITVLCGIISDKRMTDLNIWVSGGMYIE